MSRLEASGLRLSYRRGRFRRGAEVRALDDVDLILESASITGLVGPSGCGKSTLARVLALLETPQEGVVRFGDEEVSSLRGDALRIARRRVQMLFQDPAAALNPRFDVAAAIAEPLRLDPQKRCSTPAAQRERAAELLLEVDLEPALLDRSVGALSGGQRQRVTIARALAAEPQALILDEGLSRLDPELRARVITLLLDVRERRGLTLLAISHDLRLVAEIAQRVLVMDAGRIVEDKTPQDLLAAPEHPCTRELVAALNALRA